MRVEQIGDATLYLADCREIVQMVNADVVITDPPYGVGIKYGDNYDDSRDSYWQWFKPFLSHLRSRIPRVVFTHTVSALKQLEGWDWVGVWNKPGSFGARIGNSAVLPHWEPIFMYGIHTQGTKSEYTSDVITWNPEPAKAGINGIGREKWFGGVFDSHPCPKPLGLIERLVAAFSSPGEIVFDPFLGSGTTGVACAKLGRKFIGVEIEPKYFDAACRRIDQAYAQGKLFDPPLGGNDYEQTAMFGAA